MKKIALLIAALFLTLGLFGQKQDGQFVKEKVAKVCKFVELNKDQQTKLEKVFLNYQKEAKAAKGDRPKLQKIISKLHTDMEGVMGVEKYKSYKEKVGQDPEANKKRKR